MSTLARTRSDDCLSDLTLDRLAAAELDDTATARAQAHLRGCAMCRDRAGALDAQRAEFRAARRVLPAPPGARPQPQPRRRWRALAGGGFLAAAAAALLFFIVLPPGPETRIKGGDRLGFYVKRGDAVWRGRPDQVLHPGDAVRFDLAGSAGRWIAVLSLDGGGRASIYFPAGPSAALVPAGPLPASTVLDGQLGTEQLIGLFCDRAEALEPLRRTLEQTGKLVPPDGCDIDILTVEKRAP